MPTIYPNLVPTVLPGNLFSSFVNDQSLSIRWITKNDPVMFEVSNRPIADTVIRQLILAKAVDQINLRLGHQALFPFIMQTKIISGTSLIDIPLSWIWDMNVALPEKWEDYAQHSYGFFPLSTKNLSAKEVLSFRDNAFQNYFTNHKYLNMIENKFGKRAKEHIQEMTKIKLKRKLLGD